MWTRYVKSDIGCKAQVAGMVDNIDHDVQCVSCSAASRRRPSPLMRNNVLCWIPGAMALTCLIHKRQMIPVQEGSAPKWLLITHTACERLRPPAEPQPPPPQPLPGVVDSSRPVGTISGRCQESKMMNYEYPGDVDRTPALGREKSPFSLVLFRLPNKQTDSEERVVVGVIDFYLSFSMASD